MPEIMTDDEYSDLASFHANENAWRRLIIDIVDFGIENACKALVDGPQSVYYVNHFDDVDMLLRGEDTLVVTATCCNGAKFHKEIKMKIPSTVWIG